MSGFALRFYRDEIGPGDGSLALPAGVRTIYVWNGSVRVDGTTVTEDEAWFGDGPVTLEGAGATLWRCEFASAAAEPVLLPDGRSVMLLEPPLTTLPPEGDQMMRCDSVAFPPGGCAYTHTHKGPGIRCLREGTIRIDSDGQSHHYGPGEPWFEAGRFRSSPRRTPRATVVSSASPSCRARWTARARSPMSCRKIATSRNRRPTAVISTASSTADETLSHPPHSRLTGGIGTLRMVEVS